MLGFKVALTLIGLTTFQATIEKDFSAFVEKAPYVAAVVTVVWIQNKQQERIINNFTDTMRLIQSTFMETAKECHNVQGGSVQTSKEIIGRMDKLTARNEAVLERIK